MERLKNLPIWVWVLALILVLFLLAKVITGLLTFLITAVAIVFITIFSNLMVVNYSKTHSWEKAFEKTIEDLKQLRRQIFKI